MHKPEVSFSENISHADIAVIVVVMSMVFLVGVYASMVTNEWSFCTSKKKEKEQLQVLEEGPDVGNFFLAGKSMTYLLIGTSLFASNVGSEHFVGQAGDGARRGLGVAMYELYAAILLLLLGWVFAPIYRRCGVYTTPEFMEYRFNAACRSYLSFLTCVLYVLTKMSASIYGGAVVLSTALGWDLYWSAGICIVLSSLYTMTGGLRSVMYTDIFQTIVFVSGGFVVMGFSLHAVGGFSGLQEKLADQGKEDYWHIFKPTSDEDYPWTGMLIGQPIGSIWYWCFDQDLVQRVLAAKDNVHAKGGCVFAAVLKLLPLFIMIIPGVVAGVLYDFSETPHGVDDAYPVLLVNLMPSGVIGLMIASIMTAMMSSLDSVFNAGSAVVTNDLYRKWNPKASEQQLVWVGRVATAGFAILSFLWIPIISNGDGLYRQVVEIQGYLAPSVGIVLLLGVVSTRINQYGAMAGLFGGGIFGFSRLIIAVGFPQLKGEMPGVIDSFFFMNFQHFAILQWVWSGMLCVGVSLWTPAPSDVEKFTIQWSEVFAKSIDDTYYRPWVRHFVLASAIAVLAATFTIWGVFA